MTLTNVVGYSGLSAEGTPSSTNVANKVTIGETLARQAWTDATIAYSFKVTATGGTDVATLTLSSGAVAQTVGTPTITDAAEDFEGSALGTLTTLYGLLVTGTVVGGAQVRVAGSVSGTLEGDLIAAGDVLSWVLVTGYTVGAATVTITFVAIGDECEVVVIGK